MAYLRYYTMAGVYGLKNSIKVNLDWYFNPTGNPPFVAPTDIRDTRTDLPTLESLARDTSSPSTTDPENALRVFESLPDLTLRQAADERLWVYLCHVVNPQYIAHRWLTNRPDSDEKAISLIRSHFFVGSNRALIRDNGLSRLWWLGKIAHLVNEDDPEQFVRILLHRRDVQYGLIGRPSVATNIRVFQAVYAVLAEDWGDSRRLFERDVFRRWMGGLNRRGGVVLLDALPDDSLRKLVSELAQEALS